METTISKLEDLFTQTENDLNLLSYKVNKQYAALDESSTEEAVSNSVNAVQVVECIGDLRSELAKVTEDMNTLQQEQKQIVQSVKLELSALFETINSLKTATGDAPFKE